MSHPRRNRVFAAMLVLWAGICGAQTPRSPAGPADDVEIKLPPGIPSEKVFIRYILTGQEFFGWVQPRPGVSSYLISKLRNGRPAAKFRAIIYAPGCAIGTVVLTPSNSEVQSYSFDCRPLPDIAIAGTRFTGVISKYRRSTLRAGLRRSSGLRIISRLGYPLAKLPKSLLANPSDWWCRTFHKIRWQEHRITLAQFRFGPQAERMTKSLVNQI
jgi:hypothetical protein